MKMLLTKMFIPKRLFRISLVLTGLVVFAAAAFAQDRKPLEPRPADNRFVGEPGQPTPRPNLLRELGLSPDQIQALRKLNQERKPIEDAARKRFQDATGLSSKPYRISIRRSRTRPDQVLERAGGSPASYTRTVNEV